MATRSHWTVECATCGKRLTLTSMQDGGYSVGHCDAHPSTSYVRQVQHYSDAASTATIVTPALRHYDT